jgi:anti-sigma factor RsiW
MVQCNKIAPLLGAFEDGELQPHEMQEVARHLASCRSCEEALAGYSDLGRMLRDAVAPPALDGFTASVQARLEQLRPPLRIRLDRRLGTWRERFGGGLAIAFAMAATAILTVVITTPLARNMIGAGNHVTQVARRDVSALARDAVQAPAALASAAIGEPGTIISKLETSNPDVAVWSEPSQGTTVIWLPDQQP